MNLADNLKRIRKENNLSQEQLAEKLGVSRQAVSKWESGQSYPEMDKVIQICSLFNLNMNELINENLNQVREEKEEKNIANNIVNSFFAYITKVVDMFSSMKAKQVIGCLFEQVIIGFILFLIFAFIAGIASGLGSSVIYYILPSKASRILLVLLGTIYAIVALVLGIAIMLHIFKIRYLDYYEFVKEPIKQDEKDLETNKEEHNNDLEEKKDFLENDKQKIVLEKKPEKVIIRDPKCSDFNFLSGIGKGLLFIIKFFTSWILFCFAMGFIGIVICLVLSFLFVKTGILFIGVLLALLGCLAICAICIEIMYNFIFSRKNSKSRLFIMGIISLIFIGIGSGMLIVGFSEFDVMTKNTDLVNEEYILEMKDNLMIARYYNYYHNIEYIEEDRKDVKIEVLHSKYFISNFTEEGGLIYIYNYVPDGEVMNMLRMIIKDINNKKIVNYDEIENVKVYASKENIEVMKKNRREYYDEIDRILEELESSQKDANQLNYEIDRLEDFLESHDYIIKRDSNGRIVEIYKEKNLEDYDYEE